MVRGIRSTGFKSPATRPIGVYSAKSENMRPFSWFFDHAAFSGDEALLGDDWFPLREQLMEISGVCVVCVCVCMVVFFFCLLLVQVRSCSR